MLAVDVCMEAVYTVNPFMHKLSCQSNTLVECTAINCIQTSAPNSACNWYRDT